MQECAVAVDDQVHDNNIKGAVMLKKLLALIGFTLSIAANAATWTLQDVTFDDGGVAIGSFDYDSGSGYSNIAISTSGGGKTSAFFDQRALVQLVWIDEDELYLEEFDFGPRTMGLRFQSSLNSGASTISLITAIGYSWETYFVCSDPYYIPVFDICESPAPQSWERNIISGSVVSSVPLPAAAWLFGSALVGLVGLGRRNKA